MSGRIYEVALQVDDIPSHRLTPILKFAPGEPWHGDMRECQLLHDCLDAGQYVIEGGYPCPDGDCERKRHPPERICAYYQRSYSHYPGWEVVWPPPEDPLMRRLYDADPKSVRGSLSPARGPGGFAVTSARSLDLTGSESHA